MSEGEHTIISKIPRERLNQIAGRKLAALGIPVKLGADREHLEGELTFASGKVVNPATGHPLERARFEVVGHDHLRFPDPPLAALQPISFYDVEKSAALEERLAAALQKRAAALQEVAGRMRRLKLNATLDPQRLALRAVVQTTGHAFELLGTPEGVRVARVAPVGGKPFDVPATIPALKLEELQTPVDLEVHLSGAVKALEQAAGPAKAPARAPAAAAPAKGGSDIVPMPPPRTALTLALLHGKLGGEMMIAPNAPIELVQEFQFSGTRYRFVATREMGATFKGRLIGPSGDAWSDKFELGAFPGIFALVSGVLGGKLAEADRSVAADRAGAASPDSMGELKAAEVVPQHLVPNPGEVWVMHVVIEQEDAEEVRYVGTDIDGRPYGAARVLKRPDFEAVFTQERGGWRLLILVDQVVGDSVLYRQLDRGRQPLGASKKMSTAILVANFVPEAAAY